jgi:hypothetical protein
VTETGKTGLRWALLAIAVLAAHAWLLGGWKALVPPAPRATPWKARTVAPPSVIEPAAPAKLERTAATSPPAAP